MFVSAKLPASLEAYNFIFLDSINRLELLPAELNQLKADNPSQSFIFVFQATKDGNFRGATSFQHDVDVVIIYPKKALLVSMVDLTKDEKQPYLIEDRFSRQR